MPRKMRILCRVTSEAAQELAIGTFLMAWNARGVTKHVGHFHCSPVEDLAYGTAVAYREGVKGLSFRNRDTDNGLV